MFLAFADEHEITNILNEINKLLAEVGLNLNF